jgi:hypothetical protein
MPDEKTPTAVPAEGAPIHDGELADSELTKVSGGAISIPDLRHMVTPMFGSGVDEGSPSDSPRPPVGDPHPPKVR